MSERSLDNIDLTKLFVYVLGFMALCAVLIVFLIMPVIRDYKKTVVQLGHQNNINIGINEKFQISKNRLDGLQNENKDILERFNTDFNESELLDFLNEYFVDSNLTKIPKAEQKYLQQEFNASAILDNPKKFYDFVNALQTYKNVIKLELPIDLRSREDGDIDIKFALKVYSSKTEGNVTQK